MSQAATLTSKQLIRALSKAKISVLEISFAGGGDSGGIEEVKCFDKDNIELEYKVDDKLPGSKKRFDEILDSWFYEFMNISTEVDWYHNSGGTGNITIHVSLDDPSIEMSVSATGYAYYEKEPILAGDI